MRRVSFGMIQLVFTFPREDLKPEMLEIIYSNELLLSGSPEQLYRLLKAFKMVSQVEDKK